MTHGQEEAFSRVSDFFSLLNDLEISVFSYMLAYWPYHDHLSDIVVNKFYDWSVAR